MDVEQQKKLVKMLKAVEALEEYKKFVTDICFDYKNNPEIGLMAIKVLSKGRMNEEDFREVWLKWRENIGLSAPGKEEKNEV